MARVSERPCVRETACEVAVREGDDGRYAGTHNRMCEYECHGEVCKRRDTQECVRGMATTTAPDKGQKAE